MIIRHALGSAAVLLASLGVAATARAQDLAPPPATTPNGQPATGGTPYGAYGQPQSGAPYGQPQYGQPQYGTQGGQYGQYGQQGPIQPSSNDGEDSGRGLEFFYVKGGPAFSYVGLKTFSSDKLGVAKGTSSVGPELDLGLGVRLLILTLGPRLRWHALRGHDLWQVNGEAELHIPLGNLDPFFGLHGGYSFLSNFSDNPTITPSASGPHTADLALHGFDIGLQGGVDYYLSPLFSVGGEASLEMLVFSRPEDSASTDPTFSQSGSSLGFGGLLGLHAGLHL